MIKVQTLDLINNIEHVVVPTIFPDGTSQVWHLPEEIIKSANLKIIWNFETERELIDIYSLASLLKSDHNDLRITHLHVPYLPYARQDKEKNNNSTFNLNILADVLNSLNFNLITSIDVHNPAKTKSLINRFKNIEVKELIFKARNYIATDGIVFPDTGALNRYALPLANGAIICAKTRNQATGEIDGHRILNRYGLSIKRCKRVLIVDDICDGGATFISIAKMLKEINPDLFIDLYVTHGIFSKGKQVLRDAGIDNIYTTNSLLKNTEGFKV